MQAVLSVESLTKRYSKNDAPALLDASFDAAPGEMIGIIGPSGAGKSTLLRCINRLIEANAGKVHIEGRCITQLPPREVRKLRRRVGMVFQHFNLVNRLTVMQNVLHGRLGYMSTLAGVLSQYTEEDKEKALLLMDTTGLKSFMHKRAGELSGGQKQRVGIVRALMQEPSILLCDEPIASLDPASARVVMDMLKKLSRERNITCIVNLHQVDVAMEYSDRIIGMSAGRIVYDGPAKALGDVIIERIYGKPMSELILHGEHTHAG